MFAVLIGTGLRVGEAVGLRWCDIDLDEGIVDVNHTLVYYRHAVNGCYCNVHTPKTANGVRQVPMLAFVKEAFQQERDRQAAAGIKCEATVDGYTDFIFVNRFGQPQHQGTLNKALRRIIRDCNDEAMAKGAALLLPHFSCHSLRHPYVKHGSKNFRCLMLLKAHQAPVFMRLSAKASLGHAIIMPFQMFPQTNP